MQRQPAPSAQIGHRLSITLLVSSLIALGLLNTESLEAQDKAQQAVQEKSTADSDVEEPVVEATKHFGKLKDNVLFYSSFNGSTTADFAKGKANLFTADNKKDMPNAKPGLLDPAVSLTDGIGVTGDALEFTARKRKRTFYRSALNMGYNQKSWNGCVSFWLQLDPAKDLEPGFCDPIQITDTRFDDAAIWVDFTKENPRDFRLGVIGDVNEWNPKKTSPHTNPEFAKRLIPAQQPKFSRDKWTHVVINFEGLNSDTAKTQFYVDGALQGGLAVSEAFTWEVEKSNILLGVGYIGLFDELTIFDRPLTASEVKQVFEAKGGSIVESK